VANAVVLVGVLFIPTLLGGLAVGTARLWRRYERRDRGPLPVGPPIERIAADLRRLNGQRGELSRRAPGPGRGMRWRALEAAYVDVLITACRVLEVAPPRASAGGTVAPAEIRRVEIELHGRGLDVRPRPAV
jgi:hypothetical protein